MKKILIVMLIMSGSAFFSLKAGVDDVLSFVSKKNVEGYLKPFVTSLGVGLNSGMYHSAAVPDEFSYGLKLNGMFVLIPEDQKTFKPYTPEGYTSESTATVYGEAAVTDLTNDGNLKKTTVELHLLLKAEGEL